MNSEYPPLFGYRLPRFIADDGRWRKLCRPWFAKPVPVFSRRKTRIRDRRLPLGDGRAGS